MSVNLHRRKDAPIARQRWSTLAIAAIGLLCAQVGHAAGFGQLRVQSNLGQPLQAEIDISGVTAEEADSLSVKLASPDAYARAGLNYLPAVGSLRLQMERRPDGGFVARLRSNQPISEPFMDILVDLNWSSGRVSRAYTFLLDPAGAKSGPESFSPTVVQAATPDAPPAAVPGAAAPGAAAAAPAATGAAQPSRPAPARPQRPGHASATAPAARGDSYTVRSGDTLYGIASEAVQGQEDVSLDQMLVALYRNNPDAFIGGSMNRLRSGAVLTVPSAGQAQSVGRQAARHEVVARTRGFDAYRSRLAAAAAAKSVAPADGRQQAGSVTARVQEAEAAAGTRDELRLSKPERGAQAANAEAEANVAKARQLKEAEARLTQLEKNISDMQHLLELKNAEIARLGQPKGGASAATAAKPAPAPAVVPAQAAKPDAPAVAAAAAMAASSAAASASAAAAGGASAVAAAAASAPAASVGASAPLAAAASAPAAAQPGAASAVAAKRVPPVQVEPVPQPSFLDDLLANPTTLPGLGVLVALLGGYAVYRRRRQQKVAEGDGFGDSILSQESTVMGGANSLFGSAGGQSVDTSQHSVFGADFRIGNNAAEANEVDPIAEADVYIAYGRDVQAEEILREALQQNPERQAIRLKLLEIYNNRQDVEGFRVMAEEMFAQTGGHGAEWTQAAEMGRRMDPSNALYLPVTPDADGEYPAGDTQQTRPGDEWRTRDPLLDPAAPPREAALADLALPLDAFPAPAPGVPLTAPESATMVFGDALSAEPIMRLDDVIELDLPASHDGVQQDDVHVAAPALGAQTRPLSFDMSDLSLDLGGPAEVDAQAEASLPLPAPTMIRNGVLAEPIDLTRVTSEHISDSTPGLAVSTMAADGSDGSRDMQIKFDLARAYIEIGDKEGARELLQEVVDQSSEPLQSEARTLLRQVA
ncbi:pilus assembly protein FimV [Cupriavidus sp. USMAA2-4]|uniref:FimV/HubP family polar landmark protein n=1 Tax=Cupriavidus sp. USMAA2-4 TaxID=876364 RepID=UPI0008A6FF53|nr:FimV/HubP family polar landmark protein [Cupriavidus sp. USMAA2-4]AOY93334.1 pilus assembly protein FimV [Cupriavidus sp. USMAA2-4]